MNVITIHNYRYSVIISAIIIMGSVQNNRANSSVCFKKLKCDIYIKTFQFLYGYWLLST